MHALVILIAMCSFTGIKACNIRMCLTWSVDTDKLVLVCRVNSLIYKVHFFNPFGKEIGYCLAPIPHPHCFPNGSLTQDIRTNTTKLIMMGHFDNSMEGEWKCLHGTNIDKATINVTVAGLIKDQLHQNGKTCWQVYLAWTMLGLITLLIVAAFVWNFVYCISCDGIENIWKKTRALMKRMKQLVIVCPILLLIIPFIHGAAEGSNCTSDIEALYFFVGMVSAVLMLAFKVPYAEKDKKPYSKTSSTRDEEINTGEEIPLEMKDDKNSEGMREPNANFSLNELDQEQI